jgi:hypothetical protein
MRRACGPVVLLLLSSFALVAAARDSSSAPCPIRAAAPAKGKPEKRPTDAQVKQILIDESIAAYDGNCPCPYSRARNGSLCGRRSAYSRPGGAAPLCYPKDVTDDMVREYRESHAPGD